VSKQEDPRSIELADLNYVMSSQAGRNVLYRFLRYSGLDVDNFNKDTHIHAKNAGRREVGLFMRDELKYACYNKYMLMMKENEDG